MTRKPENKTRPKRKKAGKDPNVTFNISVRSSEKRGYRELVHDLLKDSTFFSHSIPCKYWIYLHFVMSNFLEAPTWARE